MVIAISAAANHFVNDCVNALLAGGRRRAGSLHLVLRVLLCLCTSIIMVRILLQQYSQYIVLQPAVAQFVTRLCIDI